MPRVGGAKHGTVDRWVQGCRCASCRVRYNKAVKNGLFITQARTEMGMTRAEYTEFSNQMLIEDVEMLASAGVSTEAVSKRLGIKPAALAKRLYRNGRADLARPFASLARRLYGYNPRVRPSGN